MILGMCPDSGLNLSIFYNYKSFTDIRGQISHSLSLIEETGHRMYQTGAENKHGARGMHKDKPESLKLLIPWLISLPLYFFPAHIFWAPALGKKLIKRTPWAWHDWTQLSHIEIVLHKVGYARYLFFLLFQIARGG